MSIKLPSQCLAKSARLVKRPFPSPLKEAVNCLWPPVTSSFELKSAYLAFPLFSSCRQGKLQSMFPKDVGRKFSGSCDLISLPSPAQILSSQQDVACIHFPINQLRFCCLHLPAFLQWASSVGQGAHEGWRQVWGLLVRDVINDFSPSSPLLPTATPKTFVVVLK